MRAIRERHPASRVLATDLAPLRTAIVGALERGCDGGVLAAAMSRKVSEAATVGLLVALARDADPSDYPAPHPRPPAITDTAARTRGVIAATVPDFAFGPTDQSP